LKASAYVFYRGLNSFAEVQAIGSARSCGGKSRRGEYQSG
jgi:hypothetical protein